MYSSLINTISKFHKSFFCNEMSAPHISLKEKCIMSVTMLNSLGLISHVHMVVKVESVETEN